jgi:diguanylate cyclase (GGDEF)-like protein
MPPQSREYAYRQSPGGHQLSEPDLKLKYESITAPRAELGTSEDYLKFRFRLLYVSLVVAIAFSGALILANWLGLNDQGRIHLRSIEVFFAVDLALAIYLWGGKDRFAVVAGLFSVAWFLVDVSALCFLSNNEFRAIWFFVQIMVTYIILGTIPGLLMAVLTFVTLVVANKYVPAPFSSNAMITMLFSLCASSAFLHFYTRRFVAYHQHLTEANELLQDLSSHDPLTGVLNARAFNEDGDFLIRSASRVGIPFSALFVDLDHFKAINDRYGHEAGDMVLKEVAACLARQTRESDLLGRIGGEEFLMLLPNTDLPGAKLLAEKLRQHIEELMPSVGATRIPITVSIGVAKNHAGRESMADIRREADQAMYRAKTEGRNRVTTLE